MMESGIGMLSRRRETVLARAPHDSASGIPALERRLRSTLAGSASAAEAEIREGPLPPSSAHFGASPFRRFYGPRSIRTMTEAIDLACRLLPEAARNNERLRQRLALRIMRSFDAGEYDAMRLAASAAMWVRV